MAKKYTVVVEITKDGVTKVKKHRGTLAELKSEKHFYDVLFWGDEWYQWDDPRSKKINIDPRGIGTLIENLNNAEKNRRIWIKSNETTIYKLA